MAYPTAESERWTDGRAQRIVTTDDFVTIASGEAKQDLRWFFEVYLRQSKLPTLKSEASNGVMKLEWVTPASLPFDMPVDVVSNGKTFRVSMLGGRATITYNGATPVVDPNGWVLRQ